MQCPTPTSPPASFTVTSTVLSIWYQRSPKPPHSYTVVPASSCLMASSTMTMRFVFVDLRPIARWWFHTPLPMRPIISATHPHSPSLHGTMGRRSPRFIEKWDIRFYQ
ncbi:hypothetical protein M405DRAFT_811972 [Rhizopogon salebrosus TDB-379]|nr:hypothetical protein M405DRAFT_811972 [Rhizopogon salebrosus TDB-379]